MKPRKIPAHPLIPAPPQIPCIIHTRVSTSAQGGEEKTSHGSQLAAGLKKVADLNGEVVATFQEEISGALYAARPDIQESLAMIEAGKAKVLIFARLDRMGRDVDNLRSIKKRVEKAGGQIVFADGIEFQKGAIGTLMYTQLAGFAEFEREIIKERMTGGLRALAQKGIQVSRTFSPYGYHIVKKSDIMRGDYSLEDEGKYFILKEQAAIVRKYIFEAKAIRNLSLYAMQKELFEAKIMTPRGCEIWSLQTIKKIIENPVYRGEGSWGRSLSTVDESRAEKGLNMRVQGMRDESEVITFPIPAIVPTEIWERANKNLREARGKHSGRKDRVYMLSGLLCCPLCDVKMKYRGKSVKAVGTGASRPRYVCRRANVAGSVQCSTMIYSALTIERAVVKGILSLCEDPDILINARKEYSDKIASRKANPPPDAAKRLKTIQATLAKISKREQVAAESKMDAKLAGGAEHVWNEILAKCQKDRAELELELKEIEGSALSAPVTAASIEASTPDEIKMLEEVLTNEDPTNGSSRHDIISHVVDRIYPEGRGIGSLGARIILLSEPDVEYSLLSQKGKISVQVRVI